MVPTHVKPYGDEGELRIGWASWDDGSFGSRSIKYAYPDASGKISRGCPELPFDVLVDMVIYAHQQGEFSTDELRRLKQALAGVPPETRRHVDPDNANSENSETIDHAALRFAEASGKAARTASRLLDASHQNREETASLSKKILDKLAAMDERQSIW